MVSTCLIVLASVTVGFVDPLTWSGDLAGDELSSPARVAIVGDELSYTVYVTETFQNQIVRYDESGTLLGTWDVPEGPIAIAVHPSNGYYYVSLRDEGKVGVYTAAGDTFTRQSFLGEGNGLVTFVRPTDVVVGAETGRIYVVDSEGDEWYVFNGSDNSFRAKGGARGVMNGEFKYPSAIVADEAHDRMLIADQDNFRVQIFSIVEHESDPDITYHTFETEFGYRMKYPVEGDMEGWMPRTLGLAVDAEGRIYLADALMGTVRIADSLTNDLGRVVTHSMDGGDLWTPGGLAFNPDFSKVYVVSTNTGSVEIYDAPTWGGRDGGSDGYDPDPPGTNGCSYDDEYAANSESPLKGRPIKTGRGLRSDSQDDPWFSGGLVPGGLRDSPGYTGPHILDDGVICGRCHGIADLPGSPEGNWEGQANLCMSCHTGGGSGMDMPINVVDVADPYVMGEGLSHAWGVSAISAAADSDGPTVGGEMERYLDDGDLKCTTCHEQHNSDTDSPYLRVPNNRDQMCRECHDTRATHSGSHPVDMVYPNAPLSYVAGASLSDVLLKDDRVECMSCHGVHGMDSGGANLGMGDGNLLRLANDDALCTSCHSGSEAPKMHATVHQQGCTICHDIHDTTNTNVSLIRQHIVGLDPSGDPVDVEGVVLTDPSVGVGPGAFVDPDPDVKGICEACHDFPDTLTAHTSLPTPTPVCTNCHTHAKAFARPPSMPAVYSGSAACASCHTEHTANQLGHSHSHKLNKVSGAPPEFPAEGVYAGVPNPPEGAAWSDVSYVIGGYYRKARFINENGHIMISADDTFDGAMGVPVQWNLEFPPGGGGLNWVDYHGTDTAPKPYDYSCFQCHTTGGTVDGGFGEWAEAGVQCEACHGPGSKHLSTVAASDITVDTGVELCGSCHTRGDDDNVIVAKGGFIRHHEQYPELIGSPHNTFGTGEDFEDGCVTCHEPHISAYYNAADGIRTTCTDCHGDEGMGIHAEVTYERGDYSEELTCVSCHMPFATKSATAAAAEVIGPDARMGDVKTHIFNINTDNVDYNAMFSGDGSEVLKDGEGQAAVTLDFVCLRCHNGVSRSATALTLEQASMVAQQMHSDEPTYVGATACGACHTNMHADWSGTLHSEAWNNLSGYGQTNDGCLGCHTVGFGEVSGYVDQTETPHLAGVQCENCHGPASQHVADPYNVHPVIDKASEVCGACHTGTHNPNYDEWSESGHAASSESGHYGSCAACHFPLGDDGGEPAVNYDVECVACHSPHVQTGNAHDPAEGRDYQLLYPEVVVGTEPSNDVDDVQDGSRFNLCGQCHHSRGRTWESTDRGPHHSLQVNTLIGEMPVPDGYPNLVPFTPSDHAVVEMQCVQCHMYGEEHADTEDATVSDGRWSEGFDGGGIDQPDNVFHAASWDGSALGLEWAITGPVLDSAVELSNDVDGAGDGTIVMELHYVGGTAILDGTLWGGSGVVTADIAHYVSTATYVYVSNAIDWAASSIAIEADMMAQAPTPYELILEADGAFDGPGGTPLPADYPAFLGVATTGQWGAVTDVVIEKPAVKGHSWHVNTESCVPCHGSAEAAAALVEGIQSVVQARLDNITDTLGDESEWGYSCCGGPPEGWEGQGAIPTEIRKVRFLLNYILGDASLGVHNAAYTGAMLDAAEALLGITPPEPAYMGSDTCAACHEPQAALQTVHGHAHKLNPVSGAPPTYPTEGVYAGVPNTPTGATWDDVSYVIGGYYRKARFINQNGNIMVSASGAFDGAMGVPTQWNLEFPPGEAGLNWVDYHASDTAPKPYNYSCFQCHTTGPQEVPGGFEDWAEPGVQCEACHGPGADHLLLPGIDTIVVDTSAAQCGTCHTRGGDPDVVLASGWYIKHHEQWPELLAGAHKAMECVECHEAHTSAYYDPGNAIIKTCSSVGCHDTYDLGEHAGETFARGLYSEALTCESCHMPYATKSATAADAAVIGPEARMGDIKTHVFNINTAAEDYTYMFNVAGDELLQDRPDGEGAVTLDFVCLRCHNGIGNADSMTLGEAATNAAGYHTP